MWRTQKVSAIDPGRMKIGIDSENVRKTIGGWKDGDNHVKSKLHERDKWS